ncbi:DJ-1 [Acaromyces ingoldii]|uniref:D-lactate dehydratase n=1 Tax=Acaromyces ingoldii TaxID=215250 RepID=A0A316YQY6_9BASI|nr:DJ-1 [Acaromyces ingoldii]PWN91960.1 DJ-1 [Acaromyces ingoldii]
MPSALILIAEGTEEMEFTIAYDVLVRGGIEVKSAFVGSSETGGTQNPHGQANDSVTCSRGVKIVPEMRLPELAGGKALEYDAIVVPGGNKGAETISKNEDVTKLLGAFYAKGKVVACICAGSLAAKAAKIGKDGSITSHPSVKGELEQDYRYSEDRVVISNNLITSRGPGTAFAFSLAIVEALQGKEKRTEIEGPMILPPTL